MLRFNYELQLTIEKKSIKRKSTLVAKLSVKRLREKTLPTVLFMVIVACTNMFLSQR